MWLIKQYSAVRLSRVFSAQTYHNYVRLGHLCKAERTACSSCFSIVVPSVGKTETDSWVMCWAEFSLHPKSL